MVYRNNTGRLGFRLHQCVLRNTLAGSKTVVSTSRNPTVVRVLALWRTILSFGVAVCVAVCVVVRVFAALFGQCLSSAMHPANSLAALRFGAAACVVRATEFILTEYGDLVTIYSYRIPLSLH